ncbi:hypothetical protein PINS_up006472 [Pythium insidiosum]|nr:hypothetical protein PINS_up006472 [Pythium insidiosum]
MRSLSYSASDAHRGSGNMTRSLHKLLLLLVLSVALALAVLPSPSLGGVLYSRDRDRGAASQQNLTSEEHAAAFVNARPANTSFSLELITRLPLKRFEFKYDALVGRTQLGVLGHEARALLPDDSVQVVAERVVTHAPSRRRVSLRNFHVVDKDSLFMHNIAATQELIHATHASEDAVQTLQRRVDAHDTRLDELQAYLEQEASAQLVEKRRIAEAEAATAAHRLEEVRVAAEEERRSQLERKQHELEVEQTKHALATQRLAEEDALRRAQNRDLVALQEESHTRLELQRRETEAVLRDKQLALDRERMALEHNASLERAHIEVAGRIRQQRENQDIERAQLSQRLEAERVKLLQALQATFDNLGQGASVLLQDRDRLAAVVGGIVALALGVYVSREVVRVVGKLVEQRLGKPSLVRETSRGAGVWGFVRSALGLQRLSWWWSSSSKPHADDALDDVVLREALDTRVREIATSVRNAIAFGAPYRHLLLYGPPGTGKTMIAKRLARSSGMEYAILSGGDVGPLGADAVTELHALFAWAKASPRGVLLFIDEAEAFLGCRATRKTHMSEAMRNALNALLFHTGSQSRHFMLVIATNRPEDLDTAVTDRIDDTLHFDLPERNERVRLLEMYFTRYVGHMPQEQLSPDDARIKTEPTPDDDGKTTTTSSTSSSAAVRRQATATVSATTAPSTRSSSSLLALLPQYGELTEGMSGREIAKMMLYLQSIVFAQQDVRVTRALLDRVIREKVDEHQRKLALRSYNER